MKKRRRDVVGAGIDVPSVVLFRRVLEGLEFVAACAGGEGFEAGFLIVERGDASGFCVDGETESGVLDSQA
jgi:hypothetical protein